MRGKISILFLLLAISSYGQGVSGAITSDGDVNIASTAWKAVSVNNKPLGKDTNVTVNFGVLDGNKGRVSGNSGCNRFSGQYYLSKSSDGKTVLGFSQLATTRMACLSKERSQVESEFLSVIPFVQSFFILNGKLSLQTIEGKVVIVLTPSK